MPNHFHVIINLKQKYALIMHLNYEYRLKQKIVTGSYKLPKTKALPKDAKATNMFDNNSEPPYNMHHFGDEINDTKLFSCVGNFLRKAVNKGDVVTGYVSDIMYNDIRQLWPDLP